MAENDAYNTQQHMRSWIQYGGASPINSLRYAGVDHSMLRVEGVDAPVLGGVTAQYIHTPGQIGSYKPVARMTSAQDLPKLDITVAEKKGGIPRQWLRQGCSFNVYELVTACGDPTNFLGGWEQYTAIYPDILVTGKNYGDRTTWNDSKLAETKLSAVLGRDPYAIGGMTFGKQAITSTGALLTDVIYGPTTVCGNCGVANDGTRILYATQQGAAAAKPAVYYSLDGGATWTQNIITTAANADTVEAVEVFGRYLVVSSKIGGGATLGGIHFSELNAITGAPTTWTKITTGFVTSKQPNDMKLINNRLWFAADGGYIYYCQDPMAGVVISSSGGAVTDNLTRIDGNDEAILAIGANAAILYSYNSGAVWSAPTNPPLAATAYNSIGVKDKNSWFVGTSTGRFFYTLNAGETAWTETTFPNSSSGSIDDILVITPELIIFAHTTTTPTVKLYQSWNGGVSFTNTKPRIQSLNTFNVIKRLAAPKTIDYTLNANNLAIAGSTAVSADGGLYLGAAAYI